MIEWRFTSWELEGLSILKALDQFYTQTRGLVNKFMHWLGPSTWPAGIGLNWLSDIP